MMNRRPCDNRAMCVQCVGAAAVAVGSASGIRAYFAARRPSWLSDRGLRVATVSLLTAAVLASGLALS